MARRPIREAAWLLAVAVALPVAAAPGELPRLHTVGTVSYLSGGIGDDESQRLIAEFDHFPLVVRLFSRIGDRNEYTSNAVVTIVDAKGATVLSQKAEGPFMLVRLPPGSYRIGATLKDRSLPPQTVRVTDRGRATATFVFAGPGG